MIVYQAAHLEINYNHKINIFPPVQCWLDRFEGEIFDFELDQSEMVELNELNRNLRILPLSWDGIFKHKDYPFTHELNDKSVY